MKTAEQRARECIDRWEKDFNADLDTAVVKALREHEDEVRDDERRRAAEDVEHVARRHFVAVDIEFDLVRAARGDAAPANSGGDSVTVEDANRRLRASRERSGLDPDTGRRKTKSEGRRGGLPGKIDATPAPEYCPPAKDYTEEDDG